MADADVETSPSTGCGCLDSLVSRNLLPLQEPQSLVIGFAFGFCHASLEHALGRPHNIMWIIFAVFFRPSASSNKQLPSRNKKMRRDPCRGAARCAPCPHDH